MSDTQERESPVSRKRRFCQACQSCRLAKAKCEPVPNESRCRRCVLNSSPCFFPPSKRGRIKGSRNRRTIEQSRRTDTINSTEVAVESSGEHNARPPFSDPPVSIPRAATPWNPENLVIDVDAPSETRRPLRNKLQRILGEFPIEHRKNDDNHADLRGLQEPMWMITGLCEKGWNLQDVHTGEKGLKDSSTTALEIHATIPPDDAKKLSMWTPHAFQEVQREQMESLKYGMFGSKYDVAQALDPIHHGLLDEPRAQELLEVYWKHINPQWAVLDPSMHTLERVRSRSALLTTVMLASASTALSVRPNDGVGNVSEATRLHAHIEKLTLVIFATAAKSVEIVQAQILLSRWGNCPRTRQDDQSWMRFAMAPRMAADIGLHLPRRYYHDYEGDPSQAEKMRLNDIRTRAYMVLNEQRYFEFSGRPPMNLRHFELTGDEIDELNRDCGQRFPVALAASYNLLIFDRDVRRRLHNHHRSTSQASLLLSAELEYISSYIQKWIDTWCFKNDVQALNWHLKHEALSTGLLLAVQVARKRLQINTSCQAYQKNCQGQQDQLQLMRDFSTRIFGEALTQTSETLCTTHRAAIFPFAASIILKLSEKRSLVLGVALRMAGTPGKPFVHTFVREAGIRMMLMLHTNCPSLIETCGLGVDYESSQLLPNDGAEVPSAEAEKEQCLQHGQDNTGQTNAGDNCSSSLEEPSLSLGSQVEADNLFNFDLTALPYVPNPSQPLQQEPWMFFPSEYLDSLLDAQNTTALDHSCSDMVDEASQFTPDAPSMAEYVAPSGPAGHPQVQVLTDQNSSPILDSSPSERVTACFGTTGTARQNHNGQRDVLSATINWLTQIRNLM